MIEKIQTGMGFVAMVLFVVALIRDAFYGEHKDFDI